MRANSSPNICWYGDAMATDFHGVQDPCDKISSTFGLQSVFSLFQNNKKIEDQAGGKQNSNLICICVRTLYRAVLVDFNSYYSCKIVNNYIFFFSMHSCQTFCYLLMYESHCQSILNVIKLIYCFKRDFFYYP